jgi:hypothetical protein
MSVGNRITEAADKYVLGDYENCLIQVCIALDATAKRAFPTESGNQAFKHFVHDNMKLITMVAFQRGRSILNLHLAHRNPKLRPDRDGVCALQEILYHVVRCGLIHEGKLPPDMEFRPGRIVSLDGNHLVLPAESLMGLILAVVSSPLNATEKYADHYRFADVPFDQLAGNPQAVLDLVKA